MQITTEWGHDDGDFERAYTLTTDSGEVLQEFTDQPTLDALRQAEKQHGERIPLANIGLPCANCGAEIQDRFAADPRGNLLCWDCAVTADAEEENGIRVNSDPTKATVSESKLHEKSLCDHIINVATGCRHGCKFCYVPTTPGYESRERMLQEQAEVEDVQREWGSYLLYKDDLPERLTDELESRDLEGDWKHTERGRGVVMLSSGTDPYQDRRAAQITHGVLLELLDREIPVRILTRSSIVIQDVDLFTDVPDLVTVGSSIPSFDQDLVKAIEPGAPPPLTRWQALDMLQLEGVSVYVSMSPTYPTMEEHDLFRLLTRFKAIRPEVVFHEPINPRGANFQMCVEALRDADKTAAIETFEKLHNEATWVRYALEQINWVQHKTRDINGPPIHSWPDRRLIDATTGELRAQLKAMRTAVSPERLGTAEAPEPADAQAPLFDDFEEIQGMVETEPDVESLLPEKTYVV